ncbi:amidohydrolase family protein [Christiangramia crocea]|uniref:Amidohydrolase family protein n=1 Tax=Christiangramia crocea TaxID=2904124 RepID=A0A9X2A8C4_9FLAO|nr:amidohydrolase family protein [Gramella crocea]MCG9972781.1 amidohydrolase family protein [Gramella crocea]
MKYLKIPALFLLISFHSIAQNNSTLETKNLSHNAYVIKNVNIIPMTADNEVIENATIVIRDNIISSVNSDSIPKNVKIIDGTDKWLIPGLIDMHVHNLADIRMSSNYPTKGATLFFNNQDFMLLYIANGVTTAFELNGRVEHFGQRNEIINGEVMGPRIALAFLIDGGNSGNYANTASDGRQTVRIAKQQGYEFIKVYSNLNAETYKAIVDEARIQKMKVIGHIPTVFKGNTRDAFVPHFGMVAHAEEFSSQTDRYTNDVAKEFAKLAKDNGTWVTPNLSNLVYIAKQARSLDSVRNLPGFKYVHPLMQSKWIVSNQYNKGTSPQRVAYFDSLVDFHIQLVKAFKEEGVPMVAGTDSGTSGIVWGISLHDELKLLVDAGLTTKEALTSATRLPAEWLEIDDRIGTIETGKFADLVLLAENPLENIKNTRKIEGVFVNGKWIGKERINIMLSELEKKNDLNKNDFDWNKRAEY